MRNLLVISVLLIVGSVAAAENVVVDFENLSLASEAYWNGSDGSGAFLSEGVSFGNSYDQQHRSWTGWAYSNKHETLSPGFQNQYSAYTNLDGSPAGGGYAGTGNYGIGYASSWAPLSLELPHETSVLGGMFANTTYTALSMLEGDPFAKAFGGADGTDPDWLILTATGFDAEGNVTGSVDHFLADYSNPFGSDEMVDDWTWFSLQPLGEVKSIQFSMSSSDVGDWGMNTPSYFAMDNLVYTVPEPATMLLMGLGGLALIRRRPAAGEGR